MEAQSLALRITQPAIVARDLLRADRETYRQFWAWSDAAVDQAMLVGVIWTIC
jgi:DNA polymerase I